MMFTWVKNYFGYKNQCEDLIQQRDAAASHALHYMGLYEALCASLPSDHESGKSTLFHWKEYADERLRLENDVLKRSLDAQNDRLDSMLRIWTDNHLRYGTPKPPSEPKQAKTRRTK
jgi:hypothetical protein